MITFGKDSTISFLLVSDEDMLSGVPNAVNLEAKYMIGATGEWHPVNSAEIRNDGEGWYTFTIPAKHCNNPDSPIIFVAQADGTVQWRDIHYPWPVLQAEPPVVTFPPDMKFSVTGTWAGQALLDEVDGGDGNSGGGTGTPTDPPTNGGGGDQTLLGPNILEDATWSFNDKDQGGMFLKDAGGWHVTLGGTVNKGMIQLYTTVRNFEQGKYQIVIRGEGPGGPLSFNMIEHGSPYGSLAMDGTLNSQMVETQGTEVVLTGEYRADDNARVRIYFPDSVVLPGESYDFTKIEMRKVLGA